MTSIILSNKPKSFQSVSGFTAIYLWSVRKRMGMSILYGILSFIAMPVILWMALLGNQNNISNHGEAAASITYDMLKAVFPFLIIPLTLLFTLLLSCMMFSYTHNKRSVDLFYALPVKRSEMFLGRYFGGLTLIFLPYIAVCLTVLITASANGMTDFRFTEIFHRMVWFLLCIIASYTFSVLVAICSGTNADTVISIIFISACYPAVIFLLASLLSSMLPGFSQYSMITPTSITALSPYASAVVPYITTTVEAKWTFTIYFVFFVIAAFVAAYKIYQHRKSESAEITVAFSAPTIAIRVMATLSAAIGMGFLFTGVISENHLCFWVGAVVGSFVANLVLEYIYSKNFKSLKKSLLYYSGMLAFLLVFYLVAAGGCFGYSSRVPSAEEISSVEVSGSMSTFDSSYYSDNKNSTTTLEQPSSVQTVVQCHQQAVDQINRKSSLRRPSIGDVANNSYISFTYHLKNGRSMTRAYTYRNWSMINTEKDKTSISIPLHNQITNLEEFKRKSILIFSKNASDISGIAIRYKKSFPSFKPTQEQAAAFYEALQKDILADTNEKRALQKDSDTFYVYVNFNKSTAAKQSSDDSSFESTSSSSESYHIYNYYENTRRVINEFNWTPTAGTQDGGTATTAEDTASRTAKE